jgi:hypothetical protein
LSQIVDTDRLQVLLDFGADPFVLKKQHFLDFGVMARGGITRRTVHRQAN